MYEHLLFTGESISIWCKRWKIHLNVGVVQLCCMLLSTLYKTAIFTHILQLLLKRSFLYSKSQVNHIESIITQTHTKSVTQMIGIFSEKKIHRNDLNAGNYAILEIILIKDTNTYTSFTQIWQKKYVCWYSTFCVLLSSKHVSATELFLSFCFYPCVCCGAKSHWLFNGCKMTASVYYFCIVITKSCRAALSNACVCIWAQCKRIRAHNEVKQNTNNSAWFFFRDFCVWYQVLWIVSLF